MNKIFLIINAFLLSLSFSSGKSYGWGFSKNNNHQQPYIGSYAEEIEGTNSYYVGDCNTKKVFLTFDAGYDNGNLVKILDILDEKDVEATFFITGDFLTRFSDLVVEIDNRGHIIGNHTWSHKNITSLSDKEIEEEIKKVEDKFYELTNKKMSPYFRPPAGVFNKKSLMKVSSLEYNTIFWSIAYKDWLNNESGSIENSVNSVINNLHNGAIILLHTVSNDNVKALPIIIDKIKNNGYEICSINEVIVNLKEFI